MGATTIDYKQLLRDALREVPRRVLSQVAADGLPGEHHFFISFRTDHPEVILSAQLRRQYPEEMNIVLQHQFWGLTVEATAFTVTLRFGGTPQQMTVPFEALTAFVDPAAPFGLKFDSDASDDEPAVTGTPENAAQEPPATADKPASAPEEASSAKVFDFDAFKRDR
jgi:hypothetical protein